MLGTLMPKGILPETYGLDALAQCLMVFDWEYQAEASWLESIEDVFSELDQSPAEGTGHLGDAKSHGKYRRVRKRLGEFLAAGGKGQNFSIRVRSDETHRQDGFLPSNLSISCNAANTSGKSAGVALRAEIIDDLKEFVRRIETPVFKCFGAFYGGAWAFPAAFGPDSYLVSLSTIPKGHKFDSNNDYSARITRWRDNIWHRKVRPSRGYFREVYPINFLLETHLNMPFRDEPLSTFMKETGVLRPCELNKKMHRWDVPPERLKEVRETLEPSGLILSSEAEPLYIN